MRASSLRNEHSVRQEEQYTRQESNESDSIAPTAAPVKTVHLSGALDPELTAIAAAWPELPEAVRAQIVRLAGGGQ